MDSRVMINGAQEVRGERQIGREFLELSAVSNERMTNIIRGRFILAHSALNLECI